MVEIETALRQDAELVTCVARLSAQRDAGVHSLGDFWRRGRISCPTREQIGSFLLGALPDDQIAAVLTYLRNFGGNSAAAVTTEQVAAARAKFADVNEPAGIPRAKIPEILAAHK